MPEDPKDETPQFLGMVLIAPDLCHLISAKVLQNCGTFHDTGEPCRGCKRIVDALQAQARTLTEMEALYTQFPDLPVTVKKGTPPSHRHRMPGGDDLN